MPKFTANLTMLFTQYPQLDRFAAAGSAVPVTREYHPKTKT